MDVVKQILINNLKNDGLHQIVSALENETADRLSPQHQAILSAAADKVRAQLKAQDIRMDMGFTGASPKSGSPGRFSDIT